MRSDCLGHRSKRLNALRWFNGLMVGSIFILPKNAIDDVWLFIKEESSQPLEPFERIELIEHASHILIIEENTNIGRRNSQPLERIEPL